MTPISSATSAPVAAKSITAAESAMHEATETTAITAQEAAKGDRVAIRKLAHDEAAKHVQPPAAAAPAAAPVAVKGSKVNVQA